MTQTRPYPVPFPFPPLGVWLLDGRDAAARSLDAAATDPSAPPQARKLGRLTRVVRATLGKEITSALGAALGGDITGILIAAWSKRRAVQDAASTTALEHDTQRLVPLADHPVSWEHETSVDVHVDERPVLSISGRICIELAVSDAVLVVHGGRLTAVRSGNCDLTGSINVQGEDIAQRTIRLPLTGSLQLGNGIRIPFRQHDAHTG